MPNFYSATLYGWKHQPKAELCTDVVFEKFVFFVYGSKDGWHVVEATSGMAVTPPCYHRKQAIRRACEVLEEKPAIFKREVFRALRNQGKSPYCEEVNHATH